MDAGPVEGAVVRLLDIACRQIQGTFGAARAPVRAAQLQIAADQIGAEVLPVALAEAAAAAACAQVRVQVGDFSRRVVVAHHAEREQTVAVVAGLLGEEVPIQFEIALPDVVPENGQIALVQSNHAFAFHGVASLPGVA